VPDQGAFRDRHERWVRVAVGVSGCSVVDPCGRTTRYDRRNRVVLASRCWRQACERRARRRRGQNSRFPGRVRISRSTIAQGRPMFGRTCGSAACIFFARGPWVLAKHPAFPAPSVQEGQLTGKTRTQMRRESAGGCA